MRQHADLLRDVGVVLNEGGANHVIRGAPPLYAVGPSDKLPFGFTIRARGAAGHGSVPRPDAAVNRLVKALARLVAWQPPIRVIDEVQRYYAAAAPLRPSPWRERLRDLRAALADPAIAEEFTRDPYNNARLRSTVSVTMREGSKKVNVIPGEATARVDARLLPDEDPHRFLDEVRRVPSSASPPAERLTPRARRA